jgi:MoaA/NifB/PqqE/SkfB family radical SAM enzyme
LKQSLSVSPVMGSVKYRDGLDLREVLNRSLRVFFKDALRVAMTDPVQGIHFLKTIRWQQAAARTRSKWEKQGIHVPPILIFSITNRCNLRCRGCYNWALRPAHPPEMESARLKSVVGEAKDLGISFVLIAGGEPLLRPEILDITESYPEGLFLVFTNGMLITDAVADRVAKQRNFVPVLSLEGREEETDGRRGGGVHRSLMTTIDRLRARNIFWSVSLTVTRTNFATLTDETFIKGLFDEGCRLFFFVEYTPVSEDTKEWILTEEQRKQLLQRRDSFRAEYRALFVAVPGDEEEIGGCLSAGLGFVHVNAAGDVEPCPFAPYSDVNLKDASLKDALQSPFLKEIRENHGRLRETEGGCALWVEREWAKSLLQGAKSPDSSAPVGGPQFSREQIGEEER